LFSLERIRGVLDSNESTDARLNAIEKATEEAGPAEASEKAGEDLFSLLDRDKGNTK